MCEATTMAHCLCHELAENGFAPIQLGSTLASVEVGCECLRNRVTEHGHLLYDMTAAAGHACKMRGTSHGDT